VIAEGIDTQEQMAYLQARGCPEGQGYLFSRPLAAASFAHLLQKGVTDAVAYWLRDPAGKLLTS
jgi:EAL domain-containing protein (putative c-di-GMP-specific phosphodiesterase class I)